MHPASRDGTTTPLSPRIAGTLACVAIALPWLNPFAPGPSPAVLQTLLSVLGVAVLLVFWQLPVSRFDWPRLAAQAWLAAALLSSLIALLQYAGISDELAPWANVTPAGEAFGNLRQRNQFATLTSIGVLALLYLVCRHGSARPDQRVGSHTLPWLGAALLLALGNAASSSRTGGAQLLLIAGLAFLWRATHRRDGQLVLVTAVVGYAAGSVLLPWLTGLDPLNNSILGRLHNNVADCNSRLVLWGNVAHLISLRPWLGWGWGELDYAHFSTLYPGARFCDILDNAHNLPLHLAVELGLPAALLICGMGLLALWRGRPWREVDPARQMAWGVLAVILLHSMLEYPLWYGPFQVAAGLSVLLLWRRRRRPVDASPRGGAVRLLLLGLAGLVLLATGYAAWDYRRISQIYLPPEDRAERYRDETLEKIRPSWLFRDQVEFAELTTTPLERNNAAHVQAMALDMLHFSPEARVAEKLIDSSILLGRSDMAAFYLARYRAAFPADHARWLGAQAAPASSGESP